MKIFWTSKYHIEKYLKKKELKLKKMKTKILNFFCKVAADPKFEL